MWTCVFSSGVDSYKQHREILDLSGHCSPGTARAGGRYMAKQLMLQSQAGKAGFSGFFSLQISTGRDDFSFGVFI